MNDSLSAVIGLANIVLSVLTYAIVIKAVLSWIRPDPNNFFVRLLDKITDPILNPLDRIIPPMGGLIITPFVAILILQFIQNSLPQLLGVY